MPPRKIIGIDVRTSPRTGRTTYRVRWRDPDNHQQYSHSFTDRGRAIDVKRSIELAGNRCYCKVHCPPDEEPGQYGAKGTSTALTWGSYARKHIADRPGIGEHYRAQFTRELDLHMGPLLGLPFEKLTRDRVSSWIRSLELAGLSPTTIHRLTVQAGSVQRAAVDSGLTTGNPFARQRTGRRDRNVREHMHCLTQEEWMRLRAALPEGSYRDFVTVLIGTGLRFGEATALRVGDVELDGPRGRLHVAQAWKSDGHNGWLIGPPKSSRSRRTVTFGGPVAEALERNLRDRPDDALVFTTPDGTPIRNSNFSGRIFRPAVSDAGLARVRIHDLRHTYCSWMLAAGVPVLEVSRRLGHESVQTTGMIYAHVMPSTDAANATVLDQIMSSDWPAAGPSPGC